MEHGDASILEALNEFPFNGIGKCTFSDHNEGRVTELDARFHYVFSDVARSADDQNLLFSAIGLFSGKMEGEKVGKGRERRCCGVGA